MKMGGNNGGNREMQECHVCGKVYKNKGSFEKHIKSHEETDSNTVATKAESESRKRVTKRGNSVSVTNIEDVRKSCIRKSSTLHASEKRTNSKSNGKESRTSLEMTKNNGKVDDDDDNESVDEEEAVDSDDDYVEENDGIVNEMGAKECKEEEEDERDELKYAGLYDEIDESGKFLCKKCNRRFTKIQSLLFHMKVHDNNRPFCCTICNKRFVRRDHLNSHMKRHVNPIRFPCDMCEMTFKRKDLLRYHKINVHGGTIYLNELRVFKRRGKRDHEKTVLCELCGKGFADKNRLKIHMKIHTDGSKHQCEYCQQSFSNSSNLNVHIRVHTGKYPYKCVVCGDCFRTSSKLKSHTRKHSSDYPFVCQVCGKICGERHLLKAHMLSHTSTKNHECSHCGKSFAHSSTLKAHVRLHTGSKPFVCQVCGHSFAQASSLNYHKRTHTGEKPYTCDICGNSYTRKTTLTTHLSRHTGTKLVSCTLCDFTCYTSKQRRKHMSTVHRPFPVNSNGSSIRIGNDVNNSSMTSICAVGPANTEHSATYETIFTQMNTPVFVARNDCISDKDHSQNIIVTSITSHSMEPGTYPTSHGEQQQMANSTPSSIALYYRNESAIHTPTSTLAYKPQTSSELHSMTTPFQPAHDVQPVTSADHDLTVTVVSHPQVIANGSASDLSINLDPMTFQSISSSLIPTPSQSSELQSVLLYPSNPAEYNANTSTPTVLALPQSLSTNLNDQSATKTLVGSHTAIPLQTKCTVSSTSPVDSSNHCKGSLSQTDGSVSRSSIWPTLGAPSRVPPIKEEQQESETVNQGFSPKKSSTSGLASALNEEKSKESSEDIVHRAMVKALVLPPVLDNCLISTSADRKTNTDISSEKKCEGGELIGRNLDGEKKSVITQITIQTHAEDASSDKPVEVQTQSVNLKAKSTVGGINLNQNDCFLEKEENISHSCEVDSQDLNSKSSAVLPVGHSCCSSSYRHDDDDDDDCDGVNEDGDNDRHIDRLSNKGLERKKMIRKGIKNTRTEKKVHDISNDAEGCGDIPHDTYRLQNKKLKMSVKKCRKETMEEKDVEILCKTRNISGKLKSKAKSFIKSDNHAISSKRLKVEPLDKGRKLKKSKPMIDEEDIIFSNDDIDDCHDDDNGETYIPKRWRKSGHKLNESLLSQNDLAKDDQLGEHDIVSDKIDAGKAIASRTRQRNTLHRNNARDSKLLMVKFKSKQSVMSGTRTRKGRRPKKVKKEREKEIDKPGQNKVIEEERMMIEEDPEVNQNSDATISKKKRGRKPGQKNAPKGVSFKCTSCDLSFHKLDLLERHLSSHKKFERYTCLYCITVFEKRIGYMDHMNTEHPGSFPFSCNKCKEFSTFDLNDLKQHVKRLHNAMEYRCHVCHSVFARSKLMKEHMTEAHGVSKAFACQVCSKSFAECSLLLLHNKFQHSETKPYQCNLCSKVFAAASKLHMHLRVHTGDKPYTCEYCGKVFAQLSHLTIHSKAHSSVKPFECNFCSQRFSHKSTLTAHVRTHTGLKPFQCSLCDKGFAQLSSLNYHKKSHEGLKPFTCDLCGKSFTRATTLKTHTMQHEGKKRFSCELCDFKCNRRHVFLKHVKKLHPGSNEKDGANSQTSPLPPSSSSSLTSLANGTSINSISSHITAMSASKDELSSTCYRVISNQLQTVHGNADNETSDNRGTASTSSTHVLDASSGLHAGLVSLNLPHLLSLHTQPPTLHHKQHPHPPPPVLQLPPPPPQNTLSASYQQTLPIPATPSLPAELGHPSPLHIQSQRIHQVLSQPFSVREPTTFLPPHSPLHPHPPPPPSQIATHNILSSLLQLSVPSSSSSSTPSSSSSSSLPINQPQNFHTIHLPQHRFIHQPPQIHHNHHHHHNNHQHQQHTEEAHAPPPSPLQPRPQPPHSDHLPQPLHSDHLPQPPHSDHLPQPVQVLLQPGTHISLQSLTHQSQSKPVPAQGASVCPPPQSSKPKETGCLVPHPHQPHKPHVPHQPHVPVTIPSLPSSLMSPPPPPSPSQPSFYV